MAARAPRAGASSRGAALTFHGTEIAPGTRAVVDLPVPDLFTHTGISLPVQIINGSRSGPALFLSAAVHGDEINGIEIIRRVMRERALRHLRGTLYAVPIVNVYGFLHKTRYLPDRRDLNRSFPGSETGSLAARMANLFLREIVARCSHGIDLHTGAVHRDNLPQVRALMDDPQTEAMARAFAMPVILNTPIVRGSLREAVEKLGVPVIVYEAGEALRFDELAIRGGVKGILSVMRAIGMLPARRGQQNGKPPLVAESSNWVRAPRSGILRMLKPLGARVQDDEVLAVISDPLGTMETGVTASAGGIVVGRTTTPLVNEGEAVYHVARFRRPRRVAGQVEELQQELDPSTDELPPPEPPIV